MRKIISKQEKEKRKRMNQFFAGGILILVITLSTLAYSFTLSEKEKSKRLVYNRFEFVKQGDFWFTKINNFQFSFKFNPEQTENLTALIEKDLNDYYNEPLYIYSESFDAEAEIYRNLYQFVLRMQNACLENETCEGNLPTKTCDNNFIIIKEINETENSGIKQEENCIFIQGEKEELTRLADKFLFEIFRIQ